MGCQAHRYTSRVGFLPWFTIELRMALPPKKPGIEGAGHWLRTLASGREFRAWLRVHHRSAAELLLRCYKAAPPSPLARRLTPGAIRSNPSPRKLAPIYQKKLRANERAWSFFRVQAPWYRRTSIFWVMEAKREETRLRRLYELIDRSARGEAIRPLAGKPLRTAGSHER
jgi:bacteriocin resistance YdeI/OmpD-like protein